MMNALRHLCKNSDNLYLSFFYVVRGLCNVKITGHGEIVSKGQTITPTQSIKQREK